MKSGTTSLRYILARHENIFIPDTEIHFFCLDDIVQHPDFFAKLGEEWAFQDYEANFTAYKSWYQHFFEEARPDQLIGEDSTVYLASPKAPERIAQLLPEVKLLFLLRDPVARTYSQYWHYLRMGRATYRFENELQYAPGTLLTRSFYKEQVERYLRIFPRTNIKFIVFEEFICNTQRVIDSVCTFLGLSHSVDLQNLDTTHHHRSKVPRLMGFHLLLNRLFRDGGAMRYASHLPVMPAPDESRISKLVRRTERRLRRLNLRQAHYPRMQPETRGFLEKLFAKENKGLSDLIRIDLKAYWPYIEG